MTLSIVCYIRLTQHVKHELDESKPCVPLIGRVFLKKLVESSWLLKSCVFLPLFFLAQLASGENQQITTLESCGAAITKSFIHPPSFRIPLTSPMLCPDMCDVTVWRHCSFTCYDVVQSDSDTHSLWHIVMALHSVQVNLWILIHLLYRRLAWALKQGLCDAIICIIFRLMFASERVRRAACPSATRFWILYAQRRLKNGTK